MCNSSKKISFVKFHWSRCDLIITSSDLQGGRIIMVVSAHCSIADCQQFWTYHWGYYQHQCRQMAVEQASRSIAAMGSQGLSLTRCRVMAIYDMPMIAIDTPHFKCSPPSQNDNVQIYDAQVQLSRNPHCITEHLFLPAPTFGR